MTHLIQNVSRVGRPSLRSRVAAAVVAGAALLALTSGVARAGDTTVSFPVTASTSLIAANYVGYGALKVSTTCNRLTHRASVWVGVQAPPLLSDGIWFEASVYVKNHANPSWTGSLYLAHVQTRVFPSSISNGVQINGYTEVIRSTYFYGAAGGAYDVGVSYRYARPGGQWTPSYSIQQTTYNIVVNSWGNQLDASTCWL